MNFKIKTIAVVVTLAALTGSSLCAQGGQPSDQQQRLYLRGQDLRELGIMNEGDTQLHGREEGENGFRDRTPALDRSDRKTRQVDQEALYAQRLALYENPGARPRAIAPIPHHMPATNPQAPPSKDEESEEPSSTTIIFALLLVLCAGLGFKALRKN